MKKFVKCDTPFSDEVVSGLRLLLLSLLVSAAVGSLANSAWQSVSLEEFSFNPDIPSFFMIAVLRMVTEIFRYGVRLQKESDELL